MKSGILQFCLFSFVLRIQHNRSCLLVMVFTIFLSHHFFPGQQQDGLLGPRPSQAQNFFMGAPSTPTYGLVPTDIDQAMQVFSINPPDDQFYMDTGATSHMTNSACILSHYFPSKHLSNNNILVGNGHLIPVYGHGHLHISPTNPSLHLKNVLHAPKSVKNLISVRKFTYVNFFFC